MISTKSFKRFAMRPENSISVFQGELDLDFN